MVRYIFILSIFCLFLSAEYSIAQPQTFDNKPENLGPNINSKYIELAPRISADGKTLYFVREGHPDNLGISNKEDDQDIWFSELQSDGTWGKAKNVGAPLNTDSYNNVISISPDGNSIMLLNVYNADGTLGSGISRSHRTSDGWSFPEKISILGYKNNDKNAEYCFSSDGKEILMAIDDGQSNGGRDIYISFLQPGNFWSQPINLGTDINTTEDEAAPFLASDGMSLYFGSRGQPGFGDMDIFISRRLDDSWKHWSKPENLGPSINTDGYDSHFSIAAKGDYAYYSSSNNSLGQDDIFRVKVTEALRPKPVILVSGHVYNQKTNEPLGSNIHYEILPEATDAGAAISNEKDGTYKIVLPAGKNYGFRAEAKGFYSVNENLDASSVAEYREIKKDLYLAPIEVNQTIRLNNIFFETAKSELKSESFAELDRVVKFLKDNENIQISINGHTDNVGADSYNLTLSDNRAKSVMTYITSKGIEAMRISSKGYGKTKPVASNDTEEGKQLNRRVEFTILKN
jgi:outer membrane protein OmpA-like peptidoglycan-associated protein